VLLHQTIEHMSIEHTCSTYFAMGWSMLFIQECLVNIHICVASGKMDFLGVKIENHFFAFVNSFIFPESEYVRYMTLRQL